MLPPETPKPSATEQQFIEIFKYLMRMYAEDHELDTLGIRKVTVKEFVEWCVAHNQPIQEETVREITTKLQVEEGVCEFIWNVFQDPYAACQVLQPIWPMLVLSGQPPVKHQPVGFLLAVTAVFADHHVLQLQTQTPWHPQKPITDGFLCALLSSQMATVINTIGHQGLDALYDEYAQPMQQRLEQGTRAAEIPGVAPNQEGQEPKT